MKKFGFPIIIFLLLGLSSCDLSNTNNSLTSDDIVAGLKKALEIGADSASVSLSKLNGYYHGDNLNVKIPLPPEAEQVRQLITNNDLAAYFDLNGKFEDVIISVNRAAEKAATEAAPIFGNAIQDLTISKGLDILNGIVPDAGAKSAGFDSTAATEYLKLKTYNSLTNLYAPYINNALGQNLGLGFSATQAWTTLTTAYNNTLNNPAVQFAISLSNIDLPNSIDTDLGVFSTQKALNGLFYMVGNEEKKIRKDPYQWTVDIIRKVFGSV